MNTPELISNIDELDGLIEDLVPVHRQQEFKALVTRLITQEKIKELKRSKLQGYITPSKKEFVDRRIAKLETTLKENK